MYGLCTYIYHKFRPNVGKYTIPWASGNGNWNSSKTFQTSSSKRLKSIPKVNSVCWSKCWTLSRCWDDSSGKIWRWKWEGLLATVPECINPNVYINISPYHILYTTRVENVEHLHPTTTVKHLHPTWHGWFLSQVEPYILESNNLEHHGENLNKLHDC